MTEQSDKGIKKKKFGNFSRYTGLNWILADMRSETPFYKKNEIQSGKAKMVFFWDIDDSFGILMKISWIFFIKIERKIEQLYIVGHLFGNSHSRSEHITKIFLNESIKRRIYFLISRDIDRINFLKESN
jgi:hypothetical protein